MMNKIVASQALRNTIAAYQRRMFASGISYTNPSNPKVFLALQKDGANAGKLVFELYADKSTELTENFASFCTGNTDGQRSYVGTKINCALPGYGMHGGDLGQEENLGATNSRLTDETLELRHFKRGILSMVSAGQHANGSQFLVTFNEANYLNGYHNPIGELVEGDSLLAQVEASSSRDGKLSAEWTVSEAGLQH